MSDLYAVETITVGVPGIYLQGAYTQLEAERLATTLWTGDVVASSMLIDQADQAFNGTLVWMCGPAVVPTPIEYDQVKVYQRTSGDYQVQLDPATATPIDLGAPAYTTLAEAVAAGIAFSLIRI